MDVYGALKAKMTDAITDLEILAGDTIPESGDGDWKDVAGTAALNLRGLADMLDSLRKGESRFAGRFPWDGPIVFPSPHDLD